MATTAFANLHYQAKAVRPPEELPPKRYWIGVLNPGKAPEPGVEEADFVWMKAHAKISVAKILFEYTKKHPEPDIELLFDHDVEPTTMVGDINHYKDNIVIFRAMEKQSRIPLRAVRRQLSVESRPNNIPIKQESTNDENSRGMVPLVPVSAEKESALPWHATPAHHSSPPQTQDSGNLTSPEPAQHIEANHAEQPLAESGPPIPEPNLSDLPTEPYETSIDPDDIFKKESSLAMEPESETKQAGVFIRQLIDQHNPGLLEAGVRKALGFLETLKTSFSQYNNQDAEAWVKTIDKLKLQARLKRTVVGVVGNTGAGKSSVINAMLDEERLVPTNCMRACTAVVTEISWNDSNNPRSKYIAEIEFISQAEWEKELYALMKEFLTEDGTVSRETTDQNTEAGIAWAKFHAVFPKKTKDQLANCTIESLMKEQSVLEVLGTTKKITEARPEPFYRGLQRYVDSKEKGTGKKKDKTKAGPLIEYWPLIKVVKIQTKSSALSTGAVIVDLPGVHDSNAARSAVAQNYMKQCTGLWIVAPITRAVDDKAAKTLLGESFKRQLKYDGGFSSVTFICSKTDDISVTEAMDSLELEEQISGLDDQKRKQTTKSKHLAEELSNLKESQVVYQQMYDCADEEIEVWEDIKDRFNDGKIVYAPIKVDKKRKKSKSNTKKSRKRHLIDRDSDDEFVVSDDEESLQSDDESDMGAIQTPRTPLREEDIESKLEQLKEEKKNARRQRVEIERRIKDARSNIKDAKERAAEIRAEINAICIAGRNQYSKGAIQLDFAAGIKELDQENAAEEDEANFNPDEDLRDYDEVARSLPVFCVSSRAYQKMSGRLQKDEDVPGFKTLEETEIPQLQTHCKKITEAGRIQTSRAFLLSVCQQLNTFSFCATEGSYALKLTDEEKRKQAVYLDNRLNELENGLGKAIESCINVMKKEMDEQIFEKYPDVIAEAVTAAPGTARRWGAHTAEGGLFWATYKAVVRRDGTYHSSTAGFKDFNADLVEPISKRLATGWERTFQNRLPKVFESYTKDSSKILHYFHGMVEERANQNGVGLASIALLKNTIYTYEQQFSDFRSVLINAMNELQRNANRDFTPTVVASMHTVYDICSEERGKGSFMRMKEHMHNHVDTVRHHVFEQATQTVKSHLNQMCRDLEATMANKVDEILATMRQDYLTVLGGVKVDATNYVSKGERDMKAEIRSALLGVDDQFRALLEGDVSQQADEQPIEQMEVDIEDEPAETVSSDEDKDTECESGHSESASSEEEEL